MPALPDFSRICYFITSNGPQAASDEVKALRAEARQLRQALSEATLEIRLLKKA
jgi:plasmid stabilization system protein ParE